MNVFDDGKRLTVEETARGLIAGMVALGPWAMPALEQALIELSGLKGHRQHVQVLFLVSRYTVAPRRCGRDIEIDEETERLLPYQDTPGWKRRADSNGQWVRRREELRGDLGGDR